jgi:hypothetical protein
MHPSSVRPSSYYLSRSRCVPLSLVRLESPIPFQIKKSPPQAVSLRKFSPSLPRTVDVEGRKLQVGAGRGDHLHQGGAPGGRVPVPQAGGAAVRDSDDGAEGTVEGDRGLDIDPRGGIVVLLAGRPRVPLGCGGGGARLV